MLHATQQVLAAALYEPVEFSGLQIWKYYWLLHENNFAEYSWQITTAYYITLLSGVVLVTIFCMFWLRVYKHQKKVKKQKKLHERYAPKLIQILGSAEEMTHSRILECLETPEDELLQNDPYYYAEMLEEARMSMYEIVYLPNMQTLAEVLGVTEHFERQLLQRKEIFRTLQMLLMLQLRISEGRLANYVNSGNKEIRMMARMNYITCSANEPYRYLMDDLNEGQSMYRTMMLNYIFGWMMFQGKHMPNFLDLANRVSNKESASFLLKEVAYWGNEQEKEEVKNYFLAEHLDVRSAAIDTVIALHDVDAEEKLKQSYYMQPENIRQQVLKALLSMNTGKQTEFFVEAYELSSSRQTREAALYCLYNYGNAGRRRFEIIRSNADAETRTLIDQVDSTVLLSQLQVL